MLDDHLQALIAIHEQNLNSVSRNTDVEVEINRVLSNLPKPEQEVLILRFYRDLPIQDIAELLDLGLSATKMRLYRALAHFARLIRTEQVATDGA
jgi:RNA polymerase sigma-70 factor (ECF subfamily)